MDRCTANHSGYQVNLRIRKRIEDAFGWANTVAGLRKLRHRWMPGVDWQFTFAMAAKTSHACRSCSERQRDARTPFEGDDRDRKRRKACVLRWQTPQDHLHPRV